MVVLKTDDQLPDGLKVMEGLERDKYDYTTLAD